MTHYVFFSGKGGVGKTTMVAFDRFIDFKDLSFGTKIMETTTTNEESIL